MCVVLQARELKSTLTYNVVVHMFFMSLLTHYKAHTTQNRG